MHNITKTLNLCFKEITSSLIKVTNKTESKMNVKDAIELKHYISL